MNDRNTLETKCQTNDLLKLGQKPVCNLQHAILDIEFWAAVALLANFWLYNKSLRKKKELDKEIIPAQHLSLPWGCVC